MATKPINSLGQTRRRRAATLILSCAVAIAVAFAAYVWTVVHQISSLEKQWHEHAVVTQIRDEQLFRLQNAFGYGGFIDNFKTFILQGDLAALDRAEEDLARAETELEALAAGGLEDLYPGLLERLRFVISAYRVRIVMADDAFSEGYSSNEIDNLVAVEDEPALDALRELSRHIHENMLRVQRDTRERLDRAAMLAAAGVLILPLIAGIAWLMIRFLQDTTAANQRAKMAARRVEAIIDASPEAMIVIDSTGKVVRANEAADRLFGYPADGVTGMNADDLSSKDLGADANGGLAGLVDATAMPVVIGRETWVKRRDGRQLPVDVSASITGDDDDVLITLLIRDATLRRDYEQGLIEARQAAERASNTKSEFLANISHEVRTPINAIIGLSGLVQKTPLTDQQWDYITKLHNAGRRLLDLVNDMLDFARIDAGRMEIVETPFDVAELIEQVATVAAVNAEEKGLDLVFRVSRDLPSIVVGDENRLGQVLSNLVSNAIKFTGEGSVVVEAESEAIEGRKSVLRFAIRDTGIGIAPEQLDALFEAFAQADTSSTRQHGGAGLGLAICQNLVEAMGGSISAESKLGEGSIFRFTVTVSTPVDLSVDRVPLPGEIEPAAFPILVVDDSEAARIVMTEELSALGFPVTSTGKASEGIAAVLSAADTDTPFSLLLIDWQMPEIDGIEAVRRIVNALGGRSLPIIIMITAYDGSTVRENAQGLPIDGFLEKPVNTSNLIDQVMRSMVARHRGDAQIARKLRSVERAASRQVNESIGDGLMAHAENAHVLIVDDNSINQQVASELLAEVGVTSEFAGDGIDAVEMLKEKPADYFDLVLMDIQMPRMDGITATETIRSDHRFDQLPIVALTAHALGEERDRCFAAGMDGHISKPVSLNQLIDTMNSWVGADRAEVEPQDVGPPPPEDDVYAREVPDDVSTVPLFDPARVTSLKNLSEGFLEQMLRDFSERYGDSADRIRELVEVGDYKEAKSLAHTIKGTSGSLGAERLFNISRSLDEALRESRDRDTINRLTVSFEQVLTSTLTSIEQDYGTN